MEGGNKERGRQRRGGRERMSVGEVQRQELKENNKKGGGGQVMQHFYKQLQTVLKNCFIIQNLAYSKIRPCNYVDSVLKQKTKRHDNFLLHIYFNINFVWMY